MQADYIIISLFLGNRHVLELKTDLSNGPATMIPLSLGPYFKHHEVQTPSFPEAASKIYFHIRDLSVTELEQ